MSEMQNNCIEVNGNGLLKDTSNNKNYQLSSLS